MKEGAQVSVNDRGAGGVLHVDYADADLPGGLE